VENKGVLGLAYSYYELKNVGQTADYSQHKFLLIPPLVLIIVFCFGLVTMDNRSATSASRAKTNNSAQQTELSQPDNLPTMPTVPVSSSDQPPSTQATNSPQTSSSPTSSKPTPTANQLQSAVPNNQAPASVPVGQPLLNAALNTVTNALPF